MPILRAQPNLFPDTLLEEATWEATDRRWIVLYTRSRQEKALSRELFHRGISFYLPLVKQVRQYGRNRRTSQAPLFAGYIFLFASETERIWSLGTNRVSRCLDVDDPKRLVHDLRQLQQLIASNAPLTVESRLLPGDPVRVRRGPFAGMEGTVIHRRGQARLLVAVNFLQKGASIEIDDFLLEPL